MNRRTSEFFDLALAHPVAILSVLGRHGGKDPVYILRDKRRDIKKVEMTFWAFQPSAAPPCLVQQLAIQQAGTPVLFIAPSRPNGQESKKDNSGPVSRDLAREYSADCKSWQPLPKGMGAVTGRLAPLGAALVLDFLEKAPQGSLLNLLEYADFLDPMRAVRTDRGASTVCVQRQSTFGHPRAMLHPNRKLIAIGRLKEPYSVWLK
jgi:hypothetical protein